MIQIEISPVPSSSSSSLTAPVRHFLRVFPLCVAAPFDAASVCLLCTVSLSSIQMASVVVIPRAGLLLLFPRR